MSSVTTTMTTSQPSDNDAAVETSASQKEGSRSRSWRRYRRHIVWDATVWVLFLFIPLVQLLLGSFAQWERLLGIAGVMGFIVAYVWAFSIQDPQAVRAGDPLPDLPIRALLGKLAGPILFSMMALPALGWWTAYFFPFFCSLVLFFTTLRRGLPTVITAVTLLTAASLAWNTHPESRWLVLGVALSGLTIVIARIAVELQERRASAERELALVSQREELGRDVHDILGHSLTVLTLKAEVARRLIERDPAASSRELDEEATRTALSAARIRVDVTGSAQDIPERQRVVLAWALREATTNVVRHAHATHVTVHLAPGLLRVSDDGIGLASDKPGNGLEGLRSRIEQEGGCLTMTSPINRRTKSSGAVDTDSTDVQSGGTRLEVRLP